MARPLRFRWQHAADSVTLGECSSVPRSRRGTWLLAGAVWLAACTGWWWVLPVEPREKWYASQPSRLVGLLADGTLATYDDPNNANLLGVRLWNPRTCKALPGEPLWRNDRLMHVVVSPDVEAIIAVLRGPQPSRPKWEVKYYSHATGRKSHLLDSTVTQNSWGDCLVAASPTRATVAVSQSMIDPRSPGQATRQWIEVWECDPPRLRSPSRALLGQ